MLFNRKKCIKALYRFQKNESFCMKKIVCLLLLSFQLCLSRVFEVPLRMITTQAPRDHQNRIPNFPCISGDSFRALADQRFDEASTGFNPSYVQKGEVVFVNVDYLDFFFKNIHHYIRQPYILLTHNSNRTISEEYRPYLDSPNMIAWFAQNVGIDHPKLFRIPTGMRNAYVHTGKMDEIKAIRNNLDDYEKKYLVYPGFVDDKKYTAYLEQLAQSKFVRIFSPEGIDSCQIWEALMVGCIPIVKKSTLDHLYEDLPVLLIDDWSLVTEEFLQEQYELMSKKTYDYRRLFIDYWFDKIKNNICDITWKDGFSSFNALLERYSRFNWQRAKREESWLLASNLYNQFINQKDDSQENKLCIPKKIHQIWLGSELSEKCKKLRQTILDLHPDWEYKLWQEEDIEKLGLTNKKMYDASKNYGQKSDIARYEILYRFGGVYLDTDFECVKPLDDLHYRLDFYVGCDYGPRFLIFNGLIGCSPGHPIMRECIESLDINKNCLKGYLNNIQGTTGPFHITRCLLKKIKDAGKCVIFPPEYFYPWPPHYCKMKTGDQSVEACISANTYCIHYWHSSWMKVAK